MRYKQELAAVNAALGQGAKQAERDKAGQPIAIGGLANAIDQKTELAKAA